MTPIGYCWVAEEDWPEWVRINAYAPGSTWNGWRQAIENLREQLIADGRRPVEVQTKPGDFLAWCVANGREVDVHARADYAGSRVVQMVQNGEL